MKKKVSRILLVFCLLGVLVLAGCDFFTGIFDPLIGSWTYSVTIGSSTMAVTYNFHADNSWDGVVTSTGSPDFTVSGTYVHDTAAGTLQMTATTGGSGTQNFTYSISSDRKTLSLTASGSTTAVAFTRN